MTYKTMLTTIKRRMVLLECKGLILTFLDEYEGWWERQGLIEFMYLLILNDI